MKKDKNFTYAIVGLVAVIIIGLIGWKMYDNSRPSALDGFASCLGEKGAKFYGAFWCPHCQAQKKLFDKSVDKLPYVECSTADGKSQLPVCTEQKVESYPTWIFADGTRLNGEQDLDELAEKTDCQLPEGF